MINLNELKKIKHTFNEFYEKEKNLKIKNYDYDLVLKLKIGWDNINIENIDYNKIYDLYYSYEKLEWRLHINSCEFEYIKYYFDFINFRLNILIKNINI